MKKILLTYILLVAGVLGGFAQVSIDTVDVSEEETKKRGMEVDRPEGIEKNINKRDEKGRRQGRWVKYYTNEIKAYEGQFRNDEPVGTFKYYYDDGVLKAKLEHKGAGVAMAEMFHENGVVMAEGKYVNREKDSIWRYYDNRSIISMMERYRKGEKHGTSRIYYMNGQVAEDTNWKNGKKHGQAVKYFKNGKVNFKGVYKDGKLHGPVKFYYPNGKEKIIGEYRNNLKYGDWEYYNDDGKIAALQRYDANGDVVKKKIFEENLTKEQKEKLEQLNKVKEIEELENE